MDYLCFYTVGSGIYYGALEFRYGRQGMLLCISKYSTGLDVFL